MGFLSLSLFIKHAQYFQLPSLCYCIFSVRSNCIFLLLDQILSMLVGGVDVSCQSFHSAHTSRVAGWDGLPMT